MDCKLVFFLDLVQRNLGHFPKLLKFMWCLNFLLAWRWNEFADPHKLEQPKGRCISFRSSDPLAGVGRQRAVHPTIDAARRAGQFDKDLRQRRNVLQLASKIPIEFYFLSVVNIPEAFPSSRCIYIFVIVSSINSFNRRRSTPTGLSGLKATGFPTTKFPEAWIVNG